MSDKLVIVIPAYNESENIIEVVKEWHEVVAKAGSESELFVINDGSKDNTEEILLGLRETYPQLRVFTKQNGGHGPAVTYGYHKALEANADYVFQTDSDGQTRPDEFWPFWEARTEYDAQFGFRKVRQDGFGRWVVTKVLRFVVLVKFKTWVTDSNVPFRLMSATSLSELLTNIPYNYNLPNILLSVLYKKRGYKMRHMQITFRPRQGGVNSINLRSISKIGRAAWSDFSSYAKRFKNN